MDVLFELCTWHALAKLCLHTKAAAHDLKTLMQQLGFMLQDFKKVVCAAYVMKDLPSEEAVQAPVDHCIIQSDIPNMASLLHTIESF